MRVSATARLLAATAICMLAAQRACAQDYGLQVTDSTPVSNPSGTTLQGAKTGVLSTSPQLNLDNAGIIRGDGHAISVFGPNGGVIVSGGPANITNSGSISGWGNGISTSYFVNPDNSSVGLAIGSTVSNSGSIVGENDDGIRLIGGGSVTNSGYIAGRVGVGADGISMFAYNGQNTSGMTTIGSVTNLAGGTIEGNRWGVVLFGGGSVNNAGTINHGVNVSGSNLLGPGQTGTFNNSGTVTGTSTLGSLDSASLDNSGAIDLINFVSDRSGNLTNSGTINYFASFNAVGIATVDNSGSIGEGLIFHGTTTANVDNSGAITATNTPNVAGTTRDAVYSDAALNFTNTDTGSVNGFVSGIRSDGASLTLNNAGTIRGNGTAVTGRIGDAGVLITGGPATITNSGTINGAGFGITTGVYSDPSTNAPSGRAIGSTVVNSGSIIGDNNDGIRLMGGGSVINSGYIAGRVGPGADGVSGFSFFDQDLNSFTVIGSVTNTATGVIEGNRFGVIFSNGGWVDNAGTISGNSGSVLLQAGAVGIEAPRNGTVNNSGTLNGTVQFNNIANASVTNSGRISSLVGNGVFTTAPSGSLAIDNQATGTITGATRGIESDGSSLSLTNAGTIRGNGTAFTLRAADAGVLILGGPATITNSGTISGAGFGITTGLYSDPDTNAASGRAIGSTVINSGSIVGDNNDGVRLMGGGTVTNSGYIAGRVGTGADGVSMFAFDDQDTSSLPQIGTVNNLAGGTIEGFRFGIIQSGGGSINNAGTINGGTNGAILIQTGFIDGKTGSVNNSGTINGSTSFSSLANASLTNSGSMAGAVLFNSDANASLTNSGTINAGAAEAVQGNSPLSLTNAVGGSITGGTAIDVSGSAFALVNHGMMRGTIGFAVYNAGTAGTAFNDGTISGHGDGLVGYYSSVTNSGSIVADAGTALLLFGSAATSVTNSGLIASDVGINMSSPGSIVNLVGGIIGGTSYGVQLGNGGSLSNAGTISGQVVLGGTAAASLTNSGTINGTIAFAGGTATFLNSGTVNAGTGTVVTLSSGNDTATLQTGSSISGAVDGGAGTDSLRLSGTIGTPTSAQTIGRFLNFESLNVVGGYWTATGNTGTFTSTNVNGGALAVNGTINSPVAVNAGAMLAGTGSITGAVSMNSGSLLAPGGNTIGTLSITGNVGFASGSTFSIQTNPSGASDKLAVTGAVTIAKGSTLQILAGIANYAPTTSYVVMTATGGINGKFDNVTTDYAYFKATVNTQQKGTITVQIAPNGKPLPSAATATTFSTATAVESLGAGSALYQSVLYQSLTGARQAFSALSGSSYSRLDALMAEDVGRVQLGFDNPQSELQAAWTGINSLGSRGMHAGSVGRRGPLSLMMIGGRYTTQLASADVVGDVDTRFLVTAAGYRAGRFQGLASLTSAWHDVSVSRAVVYPGFGEFASSHYAANSDRLDLEASSLLGSYRLGFAPYGGYSRLMMKTDGFQERGGISALRFGTRNSTIDQLRIGLRARANFNFGALTLTPHADVSLTRSWGDVVGSRQTHFVAGGNEFDSLGSSLDSRMIGVDAGVDAKVGRVTFGASYRGRFGNEFRDGSAVLRASMPF